MAPSTPPPSQKAGKKEELYTTSPLVRINSATVEELCSLHGVSLKRARAIVRSRKQEGDFHGPEELSRVEGISEKLAFTLSPHIDWTVPYRRGTKYLRSPQERLAANARYNFFIAMLFAVLWLPFWTLVYSILDIFHRSDASAYHDFFISACSVAGLFLLILAIISYKKMAMAKDKEEEIHYRRIGVTRIISGCIIFIASQMVVSFSPTSWQMGDKFSQASTTDVVKTVIFIVAMIALLTPLAIILWFPQFIQTPGIALFYDFATCAFVVIMATSAWSDRNSMNVPQFILYMLMGMTFPGFGLHLIFKKKSIFREIVPLLLSPSWVRQQRELNNWRRWLNVRVPDPDQQMILRAAIISSQQRSPVRSLLYAIIVGAGGWILLTCVQAVIQLLIGDYWHTIFNSP